MSPQASQSARLKALLDVAQALISERDLDTLLQRILREATWVVDADRGSIFLVDRGTGELWSKIAQGIGSGQEIRIAPGVGLAGHVARTGETVCLLDAYADPRFNAQVDRDTGYRTRTLLAVPMRDLQGEIVGVLQVLNKRDGAFTPDDAELLVALGGQAAAAVENALLHEEIQRLFEGFVKASVVAIEARDPSTAGHSERVALLTLGLADAVEQAGSAPWAGLRFDLGARMEIRYAALLHDFGKVGVREDVLVKADKLYPHQLALVRQRFDYARKSLEAETMRRCVDLLLAGAGRQVVDAEQARLAGRLAELDGALELILRCNRPTVLHGGSFEQLAQLQRGFFPGPDGQLQPLLQPDEVATLSIPKGSLTQDERREIESHVSHTFRFLSQIPWTRQLRRVPEIAHGHHERLDGTGYPRQLAGAAVPVESRMMAIADVYDALTASDRPYKKAVPHHAAMRILAAEVDRGQLDGDLLEVFVAADVPAQALGVDTRSPDSRRISGLF